MQGGHGGNRTPLYLVMAVASLVILASCSGWADTSGSSADDSGTGAAASVEATTTSTRPTTSTTSTSTTSTTTTSTTTTTTLPPKPKASATQSALTNSVEVKTPQWPEDVVVKPGDTVARMALNAIKDGKWAASINTITKTNITGVTDLVVDGATDVYVDDLAVSAGKVAAVGSVADSDGRARVAYWESADGATFEAGALLPDTSEDGIGVGLLDGDAPVVITQSRQPQPIQISAVRRSANGDWESSTVVADAGNYSVADVAAAGQTVVVTGGYDRGRDGLVGVVWVSTDGGATFQEVREGLDSVSVVRSPIVGPSGFVAVGDGRDNDPTRLVQSPDGVTWTPIELSLRPLDDASSAVPRDAGTITVFGEQIVVPLSPVLLEVAQVGLDGKGTVVGGPDQDDNEVYWDGIPYVVDGSLYIVALSNGGYLIAAQQADGGWALGTQSDTGPIASGARFGSLRDGVVAAAEVYPVVKQTSFGGVEWSSGQKWNVNTGDGWTAADEATIPGNPRLVESSPAADIVVAAADDPADDDRGGPNKGSRARIRTDGDWAPAEMIASGPGGDFVAAAAPLGDGFAAVGYSATISADGSATYVPIIREYVDGKWNTIDPPAGLPPQSYVVDLATSGDGDVLALGFSQAQGSAGEVFLARDRAGVWFVLETPITGQTTEVVSITGTDTNIELLVREDGQWFRYIYDEGGFNRTPITFDSGEDATPVGLAKVGEVTYLIGAAQGDQARHLAVWELNGETATTIEWSEPVGDFRMYVNDVVVVNDRMFVAGTTHQQNVVWEITVDQP